MHAYAHLGTIRSAQGGLRIGSGARARSLRAPRSCFGSRRGAPRACGVLRRCPRILQVPDRCLQRPPRFMSECTLGLQLIGNVPASCLQLCAEVKLVQNPDLCTSVKQLLTQVRMTWLAAKSSPCRGSRGLRLCQASPAGRPQRGPGARACARTGAAARQRRPRRPPRGPPADQRPPAPIVPACAWSSLNI